MNLLSIIGTRPQYIKIKPFYDFCLKNQINHKILDTRQHYSHNVSQSLINDLKLKIDFSLDIENKSELSFISECFLKIAKILNSAKPDFVLVYGDTNSTLCAALTCYKLHIPFAHVEANLRCGDMKVPEEVNRIFTDTIASIRFCSSVSSVGNTADIFCGDLEYELLTTLNPPITMGDYGVMTIHRQSNVTRSTLKNILKFCAQIPYDIKFFVHHRTMPLINKLEVPLNIKVKDACSYTDMIKNLAGCRFILTDSGGLNKISPFFGKRALVFRNKLEWKETVRDGYAKQSTLSEDDIGWLLDIPPMRQPRFYLGKENPSQTIFNVVEDFLEKYA